MCARTSPPPPCGGTCAGVGQQRGPMGRTQVRNPRQHRGALTAAGGGGRFSAGHGDSLSFRSLPAGSVFDVPCRSHVTKPARIKGRVCDGARDVASIAVQAAPAPPAASPLPPQRLHASQALSPLLTSPARWCPRLLGQR